MAGLGDSGSGGSATYGPGISVSRIGKKAVPGKQVDVPKLLLENNRLRSEVDELRVLLGVYESGCSHSTPAQEFRECVKLKAQLAQLQRQMELINGELEVCTCQLAESEAIISETCGRLTTLLADRGTATRASCEIPDNKGWKEFCNWIVPTYARLKRVRAELVREKEHGVHGHLVLFAPAGGNRFLPTKRASRHPQADSWLNTLTPTECQKLHAVHLQLVRLRPYLAQMLTDWKAVILPALPWLGSELGTELHQRFNSGVESVEKVGAAVSDLAAVIPAKDLCLGEAAAQGITGRTPTGEGHIEFPTAKELVNKLAPHLKDWKAALRVLAPECQRFRQRTLVNESVRVAVDEELKILGGISAAAAKFCSAVVRECSAAAMASPSHRDAAFDRLHAVGLLSEVCEELEQLEASPSGVLLQAFVESMRKGKTHLKAVCELLTQQDAEMTNVKVNIVQSQGYPG